MADLWSIIISYIMTQLDEENNTYSSADKPCRIQFSDVKFPSDALSVKRLRTVFPDRFDTVKGNLTDGFENFFFPVDYESPTQLVKLAEMLSEERVLAEYAFYHAIESAPNEILDEECRWCEGEARKKLEKLYQEFKLADSPETARFLIQQIQEQGAQQGERTKGRMP